MFGFLKDKIKSWLGKASKPEKTIVIKESRKSKKPEKSKKSQPEKKEKPLKKEFGTKEEKKLGKQIWKDIKKEKTDRIIEEIRESGAETKTESEIKEEITDVEEEAERSSSFFSFFKKKITEERFEQLFAELEMALLQNNVALEVVEEIKKSLRESLLGKNLTDTNVPQALSRAISNLFIPSLEFIKDIKRSVAVKQPFVIVFAGINGSGKTTTIAKVAHLLKKSGLSCCLAAADTYRAASIEQLEQHAQTLSVPIIKKEYGADPASVGFDAVSYAKKHHIDVVLVDTAGRMNTKESLMKEMEKIVRVVKPNAKIFVGESIAGNDVTEQAKSFNQIMDLTGIILSKADVDEKGGAALSVSYVTKKPILFLGTGQAYKDLEPFDKEKMIKNLGL